MWQNTRKFTNKSKFFTFSDILPWSTKWQIWNHGSKFAIPIIVFAETVQTRLSTSCESYNSCQSTNFQVFNIVKKILVWKIIEGGIEKRMDSDCFGLLLQILPWFFKVVEIQKCYLAKNAVFRVHEKWKIELNAMLYRKRYHKSEKCFRNFLQNWRYFLFISDWWGQIANYCQFLPSIYVRFA